MRARERVVRGDRVARVVERLEERELHDPHQTHRALVHRRPPEIEAQLPEHVLDHSALTGRDEQQIAGLRARGVEQPDALGLRHELGDRRVEHSAVLDAHPHQPAAPSCFARSISASRRLRPMSPASDHDRLHLVGLERTELRRREHLGDVDELHARSGGRACRFRSAPSRRAR